MQQALRLFYRHCGVAADPYEPNSSPSPSSSYREFGAAYKSFPVISVQALNRSPITFMLAMLIASGALRLSGESCSFSSINWIQAIPLQGQISKIHSLMISPSLAGFLFILFQLSKPFFLSSLFFSGCPTQSFELSVNADPPSEHRGETKILLLLLFYNGTQEACGES